MDRSWILPTPAILAAILCVTNVDAEPIVCKGHTGRVLSVAFTPDGKKVISGGVDRMVRIWDPATGKQVRELTICDASEPDPRVTSLAVSPDGKTVAVAAGQPIPITFWDLASGKKEVKSLDANHENPWAFGVAFSPDGSHFAAAGPNGLQVWDLKEKKPVLSVPNAEWFCPRKVEFSSDGSLVASDVGIVIKWQPGEEVFRDPNIRLGGAKQLAFLPDGKSVVTTSPGESFQVWNISIGKSILSHADNKVSALFCLAVSPTGKMIATGGWPDKRIKLWDLETGKLTGQLEHHTDEVVSLSFSPHGKKLASASLDKTVMIWTLETDVSPPSAK
jgi:WD40 repeat protein